MPSVVPEPVRLGDVLLGRYRIEAMLGQGGMGQVFVAEHIRLRTRVAIKVLHPKLSARPDIVRRFDREARAAARITSPFVARVVDVDTSEGGTPFLVMELLEGIDVAEYLLRHGPPPIGVAARWLSEAAKGASAAHAAGIVHRDVKPANLFITRQADGNDVIKILDFGISRSADPIEETLTRGGVIGSPAYMAPEQLAGRTVDERADVYALGVTLFEVLAGKLPFEGRRHEAQGPPIDLLGLRPEVPAQLAGVVERCLESAADDRFQRAEELAGALAPFATNDAASPLMVPVRVTRGASVETAATEPALTATGVAPRETESLSKPLRSIAEPTPTPPIALPAAPAPRGFGRAPLIGVAIAIGVAGSAAVWLAQGEGPAATNVTNATSSPLPSSSTVEAPPAVPPRGSASADASQEVTPSAAPDPSVAPASSARPRGQEHPAQPSAKPSSSPRPSAAPTASQGGIPDLPLK